MFTSLIMLAAEANGVVALRMMKLRRGGNGARCEAERMALAVSEAGVGSAQRDDSAKRATRPTDPATKC